MSASRPPEGHISAEERRKLLMSIGGISLAVVPTLAAVLYLVVGLSFSEQSALYKAQVDNALYQRADLIKSDIAAIKDGLQQSLSDRSFEQNPASALQLIPGGRQFRIIPLSDMGVASLDPKDYGLSSLVLLDRVRKTFETGAIGFEIIKHRNISTRCGWSIRNAHTAWCSHCNTAQSYPCTVDEFGPHWAVQSLADL